MKKNIFQFLGLVAMLAFAGYNTAAVGADDQQDVSAVTQGYNYDHKLYIDLKEDYEDDTNQDHQGKDLKSGWHANWKLTDKSNGTNGAFRNLPVAANRVITWECSSNFSIVVTNTGDWEPFSPPSWSDRSAGIINSIATNNEQMVQLRLLPATRLTPGCTNFYTYGISIPPMLPIHGKGTNTPAPPTYVVDATLSWDGSESIQTVIGTQK